MSIKYKDKLTNKKDSLILNPSYSILCTDFHANLNNTVLLYGNFNGILTIKYNLLLEVNVGDENCYFTYFIFYLLLCICTAACVQL